MAEQHPRCVAVIGPGQADAATLAEAQAIGQGLARANAVVVCGGLGGVMEAVARGVSEAGGTCIGLLPDSDRSAANPYLTLAIPTGLGELRNGLVVRSADAVIAVDGSWGTMSEIALAMRAGIPVIGLRSWAVQDSRGETVEGPVVAESVEQAIQLAMTLSTSVEEPRGSGPESADRRCSAD